MESVVKGLMLYPICFPHYFFEDVEILNEYLKNVSENCKINGYFIGTCYDGNKVFNMLKNKEYQESEYIIENNEKVWEIKKMYSNSSFSF